jgi:hypothetical protein
MNQLSEEAVGYLTSHCRSLGGFQGTNAPQRFLGRMAAELEAARPTHCFPDRQKEHVTFALRTVAGSTPFVSPAVLAAAYLLNQMERYFRLLSGKLSENGTWLSPADRTVAVAALGDEVNRSRISNVALAYKVMILDQTRLAGQVFANLDATLYPVPRRAAGDVAITDLGDRIKYLRDPAGHGELGDVSAEGIFYGLVTAVVYYNQG